MWGLLTLSKVTLSNYIKLIKNKWLITLSKLSMELSTYGVQKGPKPQGRKGAPQVLEDERNRLRGVKVLRNFSGGDAP